MILLYLFLLYFEQAVWVCCSEAERREQCTVECSTWKTGEQVHLVRPEMSLKPPLVSGSHSASQLGCADTHDCSAQDGLQQAFISDSALPWLSTKQWVFGYSFLCVFHMAQDVCGTLNITPSTAVIVVRPDENQSVSLTGYAVRFNYTSTFWTRSPVREPVDHLRQVSSFPSLLHLPKLTLGKNQVTRLKIFRQK